MKTTVDETQEIRFLGDLRRLDVRPGDRYVLTVERPITRGMADRIQDVWREFMGDGAPKLLILEDGMRIGVIGPAEQGN